MNTQNNLNETYKVIVEITPTENGSINQIKTHIKEIFEVFYKYHKSYLTIKESKNNPNILIFEKVGEKRIKNILKGIPKRGFYFEVYKTCENGLCH